MTEQQLNEITPSKIRIAAMGMLAGREYLQSQLAEKLAKKFDNSSFIPEVLERLVEENLQSDHRFIEAFIRSRISRGQGETRIRLELKQRGANLALVSQLLAEADVDWYELAFQTATNKFGQSKPVDATEKAKRMRFLQYRGYNFDQINYALKQ
jgi:regulatory protein